MKEELGRGPRSPVHQAPPPPAPPAVQSRGARLGFESQLCHRLPARPWERLGAVPGQASPGKGLEQDVATCPSPACPGHVLRPSVAAGGQHPTAQLETRPAEKVTPGFLHHLNCSRHESRLIVSAAPAPRPRQLLRSISAESEVKGIVLALLCPARAGGLGGHGDQVLGGSPGRLDNTRDMPRARGGWRAASWSDSCPPGARPPQHPAWSTPAPLPDSCPGRQEQASQGGGSRGLAGKVCLHAHRRTHARAAPVAKTAQF